ncbi:ADP-ribosylglycohydrolase [Marinobacter sp. es.048]|uniref:ADP-ribosylglycohydrolase family protein n=1 Tax=Marinobacter sp. es.048 TaxID=1761795 RepID=UPI000B58CB82|nr:ADP-ribosylglycohydrolase family protein [Marinobacter sp. es.048]SNC59372.1 ADP-ribosylglycohydrolase [Marinobacter sp. es.048]
MFGAIVGDFIGSCWEGADPFNFKGDLLSDRNHFTDDTVLTIATAYAWAVAGDMKTHYRDMINDYQDLGFSESLIQWAGGFDAQQYLNEGNGAAIRVSPVVMWAKCRNEAIALSRSSASVTHYNGIAIQMAELAGAATFMAHGNCTPAEILEFARDYSPSFYIQPRSAAPYRWESVITAIEIACDTESFEDCMRHCISAGGDVDSVCAIAGAISDGLWDCPPRVVIQVLDELKRRHPDLFRMLRLSLLGAGAPKHYFRFLEKHPFTSAEQVCLPAR